MGDWIRLWYVSREVPLTHGPDGDVISRAGLA